MTPADRLTMVDFLTAVEVHGLWAGDQLAASGYPVKVIYRKAEKAAAKGYIEYGVVVDLAWLTAKGRAFLEANR